MVSYKKAIPIGLLATFVTLSTNLKSIYSGTNDLNTKDSKNEKIDLTDKKTNPNTAFLNDVYNFASNALETAPSKIDNTSISVNQISAASIPEIKPTLENTINKETEKNKTLELKPSANERKYTSRSSPSSAKSSTHSVKSENIKSSTPTTSLGFNTNELSDYNIRKIAETYVSQIKNSETKDNYVLQLASLDDLDTFMHTMANYKISPKEDAFDRALKNVLKRKTPDSPIIDFYMLKASAWQESRYTHNIVSSMDAVGYLQLTEATYLNYRPHDDFPEDAKIPENNISAGIDYYEYLIKYIMNNHPRPDTLTEKGITMLAVAGYNAGPGAFTHSYANGKRIEKSENKKWRVEYMPRESREHVKVILPKIEELRNRDTLIEYAKNYVNKKSQNLAQNSF